MIILDWIIWKIAVGFRIKWLKPGVFTFFLIEWVEDENYGLLWFAFSGIFLGLGYRK